MAQRLVKVAKELNVGTTTIVEHLVKCGFELDNKPTAKVTDEMYAVLTKEFQTSADIKEKADQLIIGTRPGQKAEPEPEVIKKVITPEPTPPPAPTPPPPPPPKPEPEPEPISKKEESEPVKEEVAPVKEPAPVAEKKEVEPKKEPEEKKIGLTIKGKIDLSPKKKKTKPKVVEPKKEEVAEPVKPKVEIEKVAPAKKEEEKAPAAAKETPKPAPAKDETVRAEAPQLKGLKILGKIDTDKLKKPKKKKKVTTDKAKTGEAPKKRKRTRKKIVAQPVNRGGGGGGNRGGRGGNSRGPNRGSGPGRRNEVKEVSQKEIEEKIKQTMARLSGGGKRKRQKIRRDNRDRIREKQELEQMEKETGKLQLTEFVSVSELASLMDVSVGEVITTCMNLGVIVSINQRLDAEIIELVASEFEHEVEFISAEEEEEEDEIIEENPEDLEPRAPIVTVMGHVDHGKTSLLDYIRKANVADGEAGGITQHIGAYEVKVGDKQITFLDTPGHEAFTAMRARGAKVTDIAIIIISADDRVMPQTKEAISHAQAAGVPIVFAINKIDKDGADPDRVKQELANMNLLVEEWGGKFQSQDISAKQGTNIEELLEKILLEAEMLELKANPETLASGTVIEASLDRGRGFVTKILVLNGNLRVGDAIVAGEHSGKIKAMFNERGKKVKNAGPSTPVLILGLSGAPQAGEKFKEVDSETEARQIASRRNQIAREQANRASKRISLDEIGRRLALGTFKELNLIIKGDVDGSIEALADSLIKQSHETVQVNVIHKAVGQIIESDVLLASASDAIIIGFQVRPSSGARKLAEREGVEIKIYSSIYEAIEELRSAIEGMLEPTKEEKIVAQVEVREIYKISRLGTIAGSYVTEGKITRNTKIRVIRDGIVVYPMKEGVTGELGSLKRFKEDAKEVKNGMECGLTIKNFNDIKAGDVIEGYEIVEIKQTLS
ncbi:MAG: translation initiation factor IF-2 [Saprospiraceae bacterium]